MSILAGKHGLIVGVANKRSISWAIAQATARGARSLTYPSERLEENVRELAATLDQPLICRRRASDQQRRGGCRVDREFGGLDFLVHGVVRAQGELDNPFVQTSREGSDHSTSAPTR
jgi:enoyl-[acyl-carrier protein] reductase I